MKSIIPYKESIPEGFICWGEDLNFERPSIDGREHKGTVTRIVNACKNSLIENDLSIYIRDIGLKEILRIRSDEKFRIILSNIEDKDTITKEFSNKKYKFVSFGEVLKLISNEITTSKDESKRKYLRLSEKALINLRDSNDLQVVRADKDLEYKKDLKKLKKNRKRKYNIENDELTGIKLRGGSQFSHIRSKASYPKIALDIENGLLINEEVHDIITANNIENEEQLLDLCNTKGWNTSWYARFQSNFQ